MELFKAREAADLELTRKTNGLASGHRLCVFSSDKIEEYNVRRSARAAGIHLATQACFGNTAMVDFQS